MKWRPTLLTLEQSIAWIVVGGFFYVVPVLFYGYGLHLHDCPGLLGMATGIGIFAYGLGSAIVVTQRNREARMRRETESSQAENR
jgi:hypothetical protein